VLRHNGEKYVFSPYDLAWDGKFYYAIGYNCPTIADKW